MNQHLVISPKCEHEFSVETAIQHNIHESLQKEFEEKAGKQIVKFKKKLEKVESETKLLKDGGINLNETFNFYSLIDLCDIFKEN